MRCQKFRNKKKPSHDTYETTIEVKRLLQLQLLTYVLQDGVLCVHCRTAPPYTVL